MSTTDKAKEGVAPIKSSHGAPPSLNDNPATSKAGASDLGKDDLQALIAARISAGKQAHAHVKKIEDAYDEKTKDTKASAAAAAPVAPSTANPNKIDTSDVDLSKGPPVMEKKDVKNMSKDDLQALIAQRISAGKKSHAYVAKLEEQHEKNIASGR